MKPFHRTLSKLRLELSTIGFRPLARAPLGLLIALAPWSAHAALGTLPGSGTSAAPYQIQDYADLAAVGKGTYSASATYRLVADLDASASDTAHADSGFAPIVFDGTFHGGGHSISELFINRPTHAAGLFEQLGANALVDSLRLVGGSITGSHEVGALAARNLGGRIQNCSATNPVIGDTAKSRVGGLVGNNSGTIRGSSAAGMISGDSGITAGGLVGWNTGTIVASHANGNVISAVVGGGLVGANFGGIDSCDATGTVDATNPAARYGGLVGTSIGARIHASHASGSITTYGDTVYVGGLIGWGVGDTIDSCYTTGAVTADAQSAFGGGLVGNGSEVIRRSHALGAVTTTGMNSVAGGLVGVGSGVISESYTKGAVTATGGNAVAGGLVGRELPALSVRIVYATGAVTTTGTNCMAGGLVGSVNAGDTITNGYATGAITATGTNAYAGGLVGSNAGVIVGCYALGKTVNSESAYLAGGLVGNNTSTILASFWDMESSGAIVGVGTGKNESGLTGLTTQQMKSTGGFAGWDFANTWILSSGDSAPKLRALSGSYQQPVMVTAKITRSTVSRTLSGTAVTISVGNGPLQVTLLNLSGRVLAHASGTGAVSLARPSAQALVLLVQSDNGPESFVLPAAR